MRIYRIEFIKRNVETIRRKTGNFIYYPSASYRVFSFLKFHQLGEKSIENAGTSNSIGFPFSFSLSLSVSSIKKTFPLWKQTRLGQNTSGNDKLAPRQSTFTHRVDDLKIRSAPVPSAAGKIPLFARIYFFSLSLFSLSALSFPPFAALLRIPFGFIGIRDHCPADRLCFLARALSSMRWKLVDQWSNIVLQGATTTPRRKDYWHSIRKVSGKVSVHEERKSQRIIGRFFSQCWRESNGISARIWDYVLRD